MDSPLTNTYRTPRPAGPTIGLLLAAGGLLLLAGLAKSYQVVTGAGKAVWPSGVLVSVSAIEILLGVWLITGIKRTLAWKLAIYAYGLLTGVSLYLAAIGLDTCGCFGSVGISPIITAVVDGCLFLALRWLEPRAVEEGSPKTVFSSTVGILSAAALCVGFGMRAAGSVGTSLDEHGLEVASDQRAASFQFAPWMGRKAAILDFADLGAQLSKGTWIIVLYRSDCKDCEEMFAENRELLSRSGESIQIALLEVPPFSGKRPDIGRCAYGRVAAARDWIIRTPDVAILEQGKIVFADGTKNGLRNAVDKLKDAK